MCFIIARAREETTASSRKSLACRLLNSKFAQSLGVFSYSLYLTHAAVLRAMLYLMAGIEHSPLLYFALTWLFDVSLSLGVGYLFYFCFERPFLARRTQQKETGRK